MTVFSEVGNARLESSMKIIIASTCLLIAVAIYSGVRPVSAEPTTMPTTAPMIFNKFCPVTREAVDPNVPTVQYKGLTIGFCCEDCAKVFKDDPEKYMANLK
jgi:YHS domain-containing protein